MTWMFYKAESFNQPIGNWSTAKVTHMNGMFREAKSFNQPIGTWNTVKVSDMSEMFYNASAFNQKLCWAGQRFIFSGTSCPVLTSAEGGLNPASCWGTGTWPGPCT